jgi:hypothetical protein
VTTRKNAVAAATQVMTITINGESHSLAPGLISLDERQIVKEQTGPKLAWFIGDGTEIDELSVAVLWWLARRASGEDDLTWEDAKATFPLILTEDDLKVEVSEPDGDDPEA